MIEISGNFSKIVIVLFVVAFIGYIIGKAMKKDSKNSILDPLVEANDEPAQSKNSEPLTDSN